MLQGDFISHLAQKGALRDAQAAEAGAAALRKAGSGSYDWSGLTKLTPSAFADELATFHSCVRLQRKDLLEGHFLGGEMSPRFLREGRLFPFANGDGAATLAIAGPLDPDTMRAVEIALRQPLKIGVATADDIDAALATAVDHEGAPEIVPADAQTGDDNLDDLRDLARGAPVVRAVDDLLRLAVEQRATDLHIEPFEGTLKVRLRIDGMLKSITAPPINMAKGILSRIKILAGLNITERRLPQDGRARLLIAGVDVDLRIATMPTMHGESSVIRLLRKGSGFVPLVDLGLAGRDEKILTTTLESPFGMVIVTGPTGSGKTTTLAASLALINEPTRKILTIEDPIEYQIPGINQTQVHPGIGLTFASALRSFLRQDPDVIMVGEMRDGETAHIGVHAALTGHLVLTTLHTNTASGAITRMIDMGVESFLLASCVRAIIGQRLVRVLCEHCKKPRTLTAGDVSVDHRLSALGLKAGETIHDPRGCEWCGNTGYRGRQGIFEVMEVTKAVRRAIGPKTDAVDLERVALEEGMTTMVADGAAKCRAGRTSVEEVFRVTASL